MRMKGWSIVMAFGRNLINAVAQSHLWQFRPKLLPNPRTNLILANGERHIVLTDESTTVANSTI